MSSGAELCLLLSLLCCVPSARFRNLTSGRVSSAGGTDTGVSARHMSPRCSCWQRRQQRLAVLSGLQEDQPRPHTKNGYSSHTSREICETHSGFIVIAAKHSHEVEFNECSCRMLIHIHKVPVSVSLPKITRTTCAMLMNFKGITQNSCALW